MLDQYLINMSVDTRLTLTQHLSWDKTKFHRHTIKCWLIHITQSILGCILTNTQSSIQMFIECWRGVDRVSVEAFMKCWSRYWWSVDWRSIECINRHSIVDDYSTHDPRLVSSSLSNTWLSVKAISLFPFGFHAKPEIVSPVSWFILRMKINYCESWLVITYSTFPWVPYLQGLLFECSKLSELPCLE